MAFKTFCDICNKELKDRQVRISAEDIYNFCHQCWANRKNWPKIHSMVTKPQV